VMLRQMPHAGDERLLERAVISPFREHLVYPDSSRTRTRPLRISSAAILVIA
jgi:hypothetical protein